MDAIIAALQLLLTPSVPVAIILGTAFGLVVGVLPGLGSVVGVTIALPFTYTLGPVPSLALVLSIYCSSVYGGSITAILINTPGTPQSAATVLDGYPMTLAGKSNSAIGWTTGASFIGGVFSAVVLTFAAPVLAKFSLSFGPIQIFALICMAMMCVVGVSAENLIKGILAGVVGVFMATVGIDTMTGIPRFDFNYFPLQGGLGLIPVLIGLFAISEVLWRAAGHDATKGVKKGQLGIKFAPLNEWLLRKRTLIKSSIMGTLIGILPGVGATTASFVSYSEARRSGRFREHFGAGEPEGVIASEAANNAVTGGALIPTLALGIPGDPVTAVVMSALIIQGIQPGPRLFLEQPDMMNAVFIALIGCNIVMLLLAIPFSRIVSSILRIHEPVLLALIVMLSVIGAYAVSGRTFDVLLMLSMGVVGYLFRLCRVPVAPIVIGLVLGPILETSLRQGLILTNNNFLLFFSFKYPIAQFFFLLTIIAIIVSVLRAKQKSQR